MQQGMEFASKALSALPAFPALLPDQHNLTTWRNGSTCRFDTHCEFGSSADRFSRPKGDPTLLIRALRYESGTHRLRLFRINHPHLVILIGR
jgi:hypothetical protein